MNKLQMVTAGLLALTALGVAALLAGNARAAGGDRLSLFVSGDTRGYLEPCGCRRDQAGGLPGRMTLVKQDFNPNHLLVDVGNLTSGGRSYELLKLHYLLRGMEQMGYAAVNLGAREAEMDREKLSKTLSESRLPFVSCNLLDESTGKPIVQASVVTSAAGLRIGITGVTECAEDRVGPGLRLRPAAEALADTLPDLKQRADYVIVLAYARPETLKAVAERFYEVDCLLGGDVPQSSETAETLNRAIAFNVTEKGKVLGKLSLKREGATFRLESAQALKVKDTIPAAPEMTALLAEFKESLRERNVELASEEGLDPIARSETTANLYAGQEACSSCHASAHKVNFPSAHTHALETLIAKKSEFDPDCLRCHTVGYGARDGFLNVKRTPNLAGVQCENCHGRGGDHIKVIKAGIRTASTFRPVTPNTCVRCHDEENSENFDYATYWPKIAHGSERKR